MKAKSTTSQKKTSGKPKLMPTRRTQRRTSPYDRRPEKSQGDDTFRVSIDPNNLDLSPSPMELLQITAWFGFLREMDICSPTSGGSADGNNSHFCKCGTVEFLEAATTHHGGVQGEIDSIVKSALKLATHFYFLAKDAATESRQNDPLIRTGHNLEILKSAMEMRGQISHIWEIASTWTSVPDRKKAKSANPSGVVKGIPSVDKRKARSDEYRSQTLMEIVSSSSTWCRWKKPSTLYQALQKAGLPHRPEATEESLESIKLSRGEISLFKAYTAALATDHDRIRKRMARQKASGTTNSEDKRNSELETLELQVPTAAGKRKNWQKILPAQKFQNFTPAPNPHDCTISTNYQFALIDESAEVRLKNVLGRLSKAAHNIGMLSVPNP